MIKVFEMFAGYGGASFSLKKAGIDFECVGYSEIDKYAIQCYEQNHKGKNYGDCIKINPNDLPDFDLLTGGFPCQSFSVAGKGLGEQDTRGTLFHEIIRIAEVKKPKYMLLENVKGLTFKPHKKTFEKILSELDRIGYDVFYKVLNSKDYGIPQNRERIFFVCFHRSLEDNQDLIFKFPEKEELKIFLKDILEDEVKEKYYLSKKQINKLKEYLGKKNKINEKVINCIGTCFGRSGSSSEELESFARTNKAIKKIIDIYEVNREPTDKNRPSYIQVDKGNHSQQDRIYNPNNCRTTIVQNIPKILDIYNNKLKENISPTLTEPHRNNLRLLQEYRIRKLTPTECFRLMGFLNDEINLNGLSNTQRYKLAGNGWDINLVSKIFKNILK